MRNSKRDITPQDIKDLSQIKTDMFLAYDLLKVEFENDDNIPESICELLYKYGESLKSLAEIHVLQLMMEESEYELGGYKLGDGTGKYAKEYMSLSDNNVVDITKGHIHKTLTAYFFLDSIDTNHTKWFIDPYELENTPVDNIKTAHGEINGALWNRTTDIKVSDKQIELLEQLTKGLYATTTNWWFDIFNRNNPNGFDVLMAELKT